MKKILILLICIPLIFASCQKEEKSSSSSSSSSSLCGSADIDFDGTNYTYNNPNYLPSIGCAMKGVANISNGDLTAVIVATNLNSSDTGPEWSMSLGLNSLTNQNINLNQTYYQAPMNPTSLNYVMITLQFSEYASATSYESYSNSSIDGNPGELTITNIDLNNETIDGYFDFIGTSTLGGNTKQISGQFTDLPVIIND